VTRYRFVAAQSSRSPVTRLCRMARVSRAAYYQWQEGRESARVAADAALTATTRAINATLARSVWVPRVVAELRAQKGDGRLGACESSALRADGRPLRSCLRRGQGIVLAVADAATEIWMPTVRRGRRELPRMRSGVAGGVGSAVVARTQRGGRRPRSPPLVINQATRLSPMSCPRPSVDRPAVGASLETSGDVPAPVELTA
jgi:hypothetical protein